MAAKRKADGAVAARAARITSAAELETFCAGAEKACLGGRTADLDRWYGTLAEAALAAAARGDRAHRLRAHHELLAALSALRRPALDSAKRRARDGYRSALREFVAQHRDKPFERLNRFFDNVNEALSRGIREDEVHYRAACSKQELKRVLASYPPKELSRSLHALYRNCERQLGADGLLQVVWRALQEELLAQHAALADRMASCYAGSGLVMPFTTDQILQIFSDIARAN